MSIALLMKGYGKLFFFSSLDGMNFKSELQPINPKVYIL